MTKFDLNSATQLQARVAHDVKELELVIEHLKTIHRDHRDALLGGAHYNFLIMDNGTLPHAAARINARAWQDWLYLNGFNNRYHYGDHKAHTATNYLVYADLHKDRRHDGVKLADMKPFSVELAQTFFTEWLADTPELLQRMLQHMKHNIGKKATFAKKFTFSTGYYDSDWDYKVANLHYVIAFLCGIDFTYSGFYTVWRNTNRACDVFALFDDAELISMEKQASGNYTVRIRADLVQPLNDLLLNGVFGLGIGVTHK